ncbi:hypothetical protein HPB49_007779 [Dermacentor silvarum]|uniref:Uncharacterized protein n=1 Tax=Dermacentor silvarum TaxID=543639 RepID=A0ACB8DXJ9_DERSI|nr:hypothetical protein HPB49_007779 [Dermacentor silvarum]
MDFIKPPEPLRLEGDISKHWELFKQRFHLFLTATEPASKKREASTKTALLLSVAGEEAFETYNTFSFMEDESMDDYDSVIKKFYEYFASQVNEVHQCYLFRSRTQEPGEPFEHFLRDLKAKAQACNLGGLADSMIRDQIVLAQTTSSAVNAGNNQLTLEKAEELCKTA